MGILLSTLALSSRKTSQLQTRNTLENGLINFKRCVSMQSIILCRYRSSRSGPHHQSRDYYTSVKLCVARLLGLAIASRAFSRNTLGHPVLLSYTEVRLTITRNWRGRVGAAHHVALAMSKRQGLCHTHALYIQPYLPAANPLRTYRSRVAPQEFVSWLTNQPQ